MLRGQDARGGRKLITYTHTQTHGTITVILAVHAHQWLIIFAAPGMCTIVCTIHYICSQLVRE